MGVLQCRRCGGNLRVDPARNIGICEYCRSEQTVPTMDDERKTALFENAGLLLSGCQFDRAASVYTQIVREFPDEAEGYWGLTLCKYGIEYVDDPGTGLKVPTCHRLSYDSVTEDTDFKLAVRYAGISAKRVYTVQSQELEEIRSGIIEVSLREQPYDIFISYKEKNDAEQRTVDSEIAQDIYSALTDKGYRVFFSRISLEDKLGKEYEPYIFAALNSAKIMLVVGTDPDHLNAVWVKNEWGRYLKLMAQDKTKYLIPCFKGMDAGELPKEFRKFTAQDMGKIGAMQDLLRGIEKLMAESKIQMPQTFTAQSVTQPTIIGGTTANSQLSRGYMALEDHEWSRANGFFEEALNLNPQCAEAYLGQLLAREQKSSLDVLFAAYEQKYSQVQAQRTEACPEDTAHIEAAIAEYLVPDYLDEQTIRNLYAFDRCYDARLPCRKQQKERQLQELKNDRLMMRALKYAVGDLKLQLGRKLNALVAVLDKRITDAERADRESIAEVKANYKNSLEAADAEAKKLNAEACRRRKQDYQSHLKAKKSAKKKRKIKILLAAAVVIGIAVVLLMKLVIIPGKNYKAAVALMDNGEYEAAITAFEALDGYKDSSDLAQESRYLEAVLQMKSGDYANAAASFEAINDYKNSSDLANESRYLEAVSLMNSGDYENAVITFETIDGYKDSSELAADILSKHPWATPIGQTLVFGSYEQDNDASNGKEAIEWIVVDRTSDGREILLVSKYALDYQQYDAGTTWETCSLRTWLNETFLNEAFTAEEQACIPTVTVTADKNPQSDASAGNDTQNQLFLLSITEVEKYFTSNDDRMCAPTAYAIARGAYISYEYSSDAGSCEWWTRSPGYDDIHGAAIVNISGHVDSGIYGAYNIDGCVRPALWLIPGA